MPSPLKVNTDIAPIYIRDDTSECNNTGGVSANLPILAQAIAADVELNDHLVPPFEAFSLGLSLLQPGCHSS